MTMTSLAPMSRHAIRPSGETRDFVKPGMSKVVARLNESSHRQHFFAQKSYSV